MKYAIRSRGTGVNVAVLSAVDRVLCRAPPYPPPEGLATVRLVSLASVLFGTYRPYLVVAVAAGAVLLLVACANLASLFPARWRSARCCSAPSGGGGRVATGSAGGAHGPSRRSRANPDGKSLVW